MFSSVFLSIFFVFFFSLIFSSFLFSFLSQFLFLSISLSPSFLPYPFLSFFTSPSLSPSYFLPLSFPLPPPFLPSPPFLLLSSPSFSLTLLPSLFLSYLLFSSPRPCSPSYIITPTWPLNRQPIHPFRENPSLSPRCRRASLPTRNGCSLLLQSIQHAHCCSDILHGQPEQHHLAVVLALHALWLYPWLCCSLRLRGSIRKYREE